LVVPRLPSGAFVWAIRLSFRPGLKPRGSPKSQPRTFSRTPGPVVLSTVEGSGGESPGSLRFYHIRISGLNSRSSQSQEFNGVNFDKLDQRPNRINVEKEKGVA